MCCTKHLKLQDPQSNHTESYASKKIKDARTVRNEQQTNEKKETFKFRLDEDNRTSDR